MQNKIERMEMEAGGINSNYISVLSLLLVSTFYLPTPQVKKGGIIGANVFFLVTEI